MNPSSTYVNTGLVTWQREREKWLNGTPQSSSKADHSVKSPSSAASASPSVIGSSTTKSSTGGEVVS